ncbi:MAG TPA: HEAT repeat domain-containing protein [Candidatus Acidoferrales bacterium]|nr:HEAT repeat domain-containing protein [Candidatus Acidoferrales bacterium]
MNSNPNPNAGDWQQANPAARSCDDWQPLLTLHAAGEELDPADLSQLNAHLAACRSCSESLAQEREVLALLAANRVEPDASLLAAARAGLDDALDREEDRGWFARAFGSMVPSSWLAPRPAWSAAVLVLIGFAVGVLAPRLMRRPLPVAPVGESASNIPSPAISSGSAPSDAIPTAIDLHTADVAGINVMPSSGEGPARVEVQLRAQQPVTVQGTVDDDNVKSVLLDILAKGDRICPDIRMDAVDCLRSRGNDPDVRSALCRAVRTDHNAAVRLKALDALKNAEPVDSVRETLLDALMDDQNPGVRVEAINALRGMAAKGQSSNDQMISILRDRMENDPNTYIRIQSAAALGELGPRAKF